MIKLYKPYLDLLNQVTGIGYVLVSNSNKFTTENYSELGFDPTTILSKSRIIHHNNHELNLTEFSKNSTPLKSYQFKIVQSNTLLETSWVLPDLFERFKQTIYSFVALLEDITNEINIQPAVACLELLSSIEPTKRIKLNPLTSLRTLSTLHDELFIAKVTIRNKKELLNIYGIPVYEKVVEALNNHLIRMYQLSNSRIPVDNAICPDSDNIIIITDLKLELFKDMLNDIQALISAFCDRGYSINVRLAVSIAHYPTLSEGVKILQQLDIVNEYIIQKANLKDFIIYINTDEGKTALNQYKLTEDLKSTLVDKASDFKVMYQPKVTCSQQLILGAEGLIRWFNSNRNKLIPPNEFIPLSENNGLIKDIGILVFRTVAKDSLQLNKKLKAINPDYPNIRLGVNVSAIQLEDYEFISQIERDVKAGKCNPEYMDIEITETVSVTNVSDTIGKLNRLRNLGFTISLDDFGTAYSSLNYLTSIPLDNLKIDKSFIDKCTASATFVDDIIGISKKLKLHTVAEGVEYESQFETLKHFNCDLIQGYYFYKPMYFSELEELMLQQATTSSTLPAI